MQRVIRLLAGVFSVALTGLALTLMFATTPAAAATPSCGDNTGKAATGTPIPIGAVMSNSGVGSFEEAAQAVAAYFKCVNANGGIHGRPIKYIVGDDQSKPDIALQVAKKLVEDDKVYALVGNTSFIECLANSNYYIQQNVLEIGLGIPPQCYQSKNISELNAGPRLSGVGAADYAARVLGVKTLVCSIANIPGGDYSCHGVEEWGKEHGVKVTSIYTDPVSPDYTSIALQIMATGADAALVFGTKDSAVQFLSAVQQQDGAAKMKWLGPTSYYSVDFPSAIDAKYWNNRLWVNI
jgi:branched-chain amino acid transport system substrate-binding protein